MRVNNLCPEALENVLSHPSVTPPRASRARRLLIALGLIPAEELRLSGRSPEGAAMRRETPPFFVAMAGGRDDGVETTVRHMYDLFGGFGGQCRPW